MKPMLPTYRPEAPESKEWNYEIKYDGFRAILTINQDSSISLTSRNHKELLPLFPELREYIHSNGIEELAPLRLDGELVWLTNEAKADFAQIQWRGRLRNAALISDAASHSPCRFVAFDLLQIGRKSLYNIPYTERRKLLEELGSKLSLPMPPNPNHSATIQLVETYENLDVPLNKMILLDGEGLVAKKKNGTWEEGKRSPSWIKVKNWRAVSCFITALHKENGYLRVAVFHQGEIREIGAVKNGISSHDKGILSALIRQNAFKEDSQFFYIHPSICIEVLFLHVFEENELREPQFSKFLLQRNPAECTWEHFLIGQFTFPDNVHITSPDKPVWQLNEEAVLKIEYLQYLREVSSSFLPFLKDKPLTAIRYPHGTLDHERFFQKNKPDYAPDSIKTFMEEDIEYILCNDIETLLWLGNQLALEFHIPFQKAGRKTPDEIVLDLDPPSIEYFHLAIKAALEIKKILDSLKIQVFIKTSGNKGLQLHIPLPEKKITYEETRLFTDFLADYLTNAFPEHFTVERMKKNRYNRLYLDFVQHSEGKTIIAPYSTRGNLFAGVATPLFWEEVNEKLKLDAFTIRTVPDRLKRKGCPFKEYKHADNDQAFSQVLSFLKKKGPAQ